MAEEIRQYIQNCERCLRCKQQPEWAELKPLEASYPLELVHMDYLKIGGKDDPNSNVLVITDHFTRFSQAYVSLRLCVQNRRKKWNLSLNFRTMHKLSDLYSGIFQNY